MSVKQKMETIAQLLRGKRVVVAFSGGVDSTVMTRLAMNFASKVLAVTAFSDVSPPYELVEAKKIALELGVVWRSVETCELDDPNFRSNPVNRCYFCKKGLMTSLQQIAQKEGYNCIVDGTNYDDVQDYRPGMEALREIGVQSPLAMAKISKQEVRLIAKEYGLSVYKKPSMACLASRFPYGETITKEKLEMVRGAEIAVREITGLDNIRVRYHFPIARIEVSRDNRDLFSENIMDQVAKTLKELGFIYVTLDLEGYRSGSMNDPIKGV